MASSNAPGLADRLGQIPVEMPTYGDRSATMHIPLYESPDNPELDCQTAAVIAFRNSLSSCQTYDLSGTRSY